MPASPPTGYSPADIKAMANQMQAAGVRSTCRELISDHGHDAFLAEPELLLDVLLRENSRN